MATRTSTASGNGSAGATWVGGVAPVDGDDVVIAGHTITLDWATIPTFNTVTFNNANSKLALSGSVTKELIATNGFFITANAAIITVASGQDLTFTGKWTCSNVSGNAGIVNGTGGNVTFRTVGADQSAILFELLVDNGSTLNCLVASWTSGNLTTIGRWRVLTTSANALVLMSGGTWTHTHTGQGQYGSITVANTSGITRLTGSARVNFTGDMLFGGSLAASGSQAPFFYSSSSLLSTIAGTWRFVSGLTAGWYAGIMFISGKITFTGSLSSTGVITTVYGTTGGAFEWKNQSATVPDGDELTFIITLASAADVGSLLIANYGRVVMHAATSGVISATGCTITNQTSNDHASATGLFSAVSVVNVASPAPTLPVQNKVELGTVYGYTGSELVGTALLFDSTLNAAIAIAVRDVNNTSPATNSLGAAINNRLAASGYTAPDNASITAIKAKTDLITTAPATEVTALAIKAKTDLIPAAPAAVSNIPTAAENAAATRDISNTAPAGGSLGAAINSRLATASYTAPDNAGISSAASAAATAATSANTAASSANSAASAAAAAASNSANAAVAAGVAEDAANAAVSAANAAASAAGTAASNSSAAASAATAAETAANTASTAAGLAANRLGGFAGTGQNTVLGMFRALWNKATGLTPSDLISGIDAADAGDNTRDSLMSLKQFLEADVLIDTSVTPWAVVHIVRGSGGIGVGVELMRKDLKDVTGAAITNTRTTIGQAVE